LAGALATYCRLKDITIGGILSLDLEKPLLEAMPDLVEFDHYIDNDVRGATTFEGLLTFLYEYYFLRLEWVGISLGPYKAKFCVKQLPLLGHCQTLSRIRLSIRRIDRIRELLLPTTSREVQKFCLSLNFFRQYILGRASLEQVLKSAIILEVQLTQVVDKLGKIKTVNRRFDLDLD
jgi:hypothetical protein